MTMTQIVPLVPAGQTDIATTTFWLTPEGSLSAYTVARSVDGIIYAEGGQAPPPGTGLDSEGLARYFRTQVQDMEKAHVAAQKVEKERAEGAAALHQEKRDKLLAGGMEDDVVDYILPPLPAVYLPVAFAVPDAIKQSLVNFGLTHEQIQRVVGGWV